MVSSTGLNHLISFYKKVQVHFGQNNISKAKNQGKTTLCLCGQSYIRFLLIYCCKILNVTFLDNKTTDPIDEKAFCVVGELNEESEIKKLEEKDCLNRLNILNVEKII